MKLACTLAFQNVGLKTSPPSREKKNISTWISAFWEKWEGKGEWVRERVTQGHNIIVDGWVGASKPHPHTPLTHTYKKVSKTHVFPLFDSIITDEPSNQQTDKWTDKP